MKKLIIFVKMYFCSRCQSTFTEERYLLKHLYNQVIPCDLFCDQCAQKFRSHHCFKQHIKNNKCKCVSMTENQIQLLITDNSDKHVQPEKNEQSNNTNDLTTEHDKLLNCTRIDRTIALEDFDLEIIKTTGIIPCGEKYDVLYNSLEKELLNYFQKNSAIKMSSKTRSLYLESELSDMVMLFYSNPKLPQFMNVINNGDERYLIFTGTEFAKDIMDKKFRCFYMLSIIYKYLNRFAKSTKSTKSLLYIYQHITKKSLPYICFQYRASYSGILPIFEECFNDNWYCLNSIKFYEFPKSIPLTYGDYKNQLVFIKNSNNKMDIRYNRSMDDKFDEFKYNLVNGSNLTINKK